VIWKKLFVCLGKDEKGKCLMNRDFTPLREIIDYVSVPSKLWMVRTQGGEYYKIFRDEGYIAIGNPKIPPLAQISEGLNDKEGNALLRLKVAEANPKMKKNAINSLIAILRSFEQEMKQGDYVIIPGKHSHKFSVGQISSSFDFLNNQPMPRVRSVEWLGEYRKSEFDHKLQKIFQYGKHVLDVSSNADYLYKKMFPVFIKDGKPYFSIPIKKKGDVSAREFFEAEKALDLFDSICRLYGFDCSSEVFTIKTQVQSEGDLLFSVVGNCTSLNLQQVRAAVVIMSMLLFGCGEGPSRQISDDYYKNTIPVHSEVNEYVDDNLLKMDKQFQQQLQDLKAAERRMNSDE